MFETAEHALLISNFFKELIYPDHPAFYQLLHSHLPPGSMFNDLGKTFVVDALSGELKQVGNDAAFTEYIEGGEFDEAMIKFSDQKDEVYCGEFA